jgi:hypothetical protein
LSTRTTRLLAFVSAIAVATPPSGVAFAQGSELAQADKAARAKDWEGALAHYDAAMQASPTPRAQLGVADALYQLGRLGEAFDAYTEAQKTYGAKLGPVDKALVATRLKELTKKTGYLSIRVNEAGAQVELDGKPIGTSPVSPLMRVAVGSHDVKVTKPGFAAFASSGAITPDATTVVDVTLAAEATKGHVVVTAPGAEPLRVLVDGVDVGATPWEGDLAPGIHQISGRSSTSLALAQDVNVIAGARAAVELVTSATAGHLQVRTSDGKGVIYVDGMVKGEGAFSGDFVPGQHTIAVTRDGYERFEKTVTIDARQTVAETVTLKAIAAGGASAAEAERALEGIYGGLGLAPIFGVGGEGTELETGCSGLGATSCETPSPIGGGLFGYVGWTWNPVGFEVMLAATGDQAKQTAAFSSASKTGTTPLTPHDEKFTFGRIGGLAAVRARATFQGRTVRGTVAGGVGLSYRQLLMKRFATETDGAANRTENYVPDGVSYLSPALTIEGALQLRVSPTVALSLGALLWADNASISGSNSVPASGQSTPHALVGTNVPAVLINTPAYHLATGPQVFLGPFFGIQFGP